MVQQRRFCINPNEGKLYICDGLASYLTNMSTGFVQQLREYEPIYKANWNMSSDVQCSTREQVTSKRKRESTENDGVAMDE